MLEALWCILTFGLGWWLRGYYDRMMDNVR
jgi:hypothetical protein